MSEQNDVLFRDPSVFARFNETVLAAHTELNLDAALRRIGGFLFLIRDELEGPDQPDAPCFTHQAMITQSAQPRLEYRPHRGCVLKEVAFLHEFERA